MHKNFYKFIFSLLSVLVLSVVLVFAVSAEVVSTGYTVNEDGDFTNIKYTKTDDGTITFEIDPTATDNVASTAIINKDPLTGDISTWNKCLPTYYGVKKLVIGDGITSLSGFACQPTLRTIEVPTSLVHIGQAAFQCIYSIDSIYVRGTEPVSGYLDLTYVESFDTYCFDGNNGIKKVKLNPNLSTPIPGEMFKSSLLKELEIPAGVPMILNEGLDGLAKLHTLTVLGMNTEFESVNVFSDLEVYPAIKAYAGSKAEEFAKANGFTFINIETEEVTQGTRPAPEIEEEEDLGPSQAPVSSYAPENATAHGHLVSVYADCWWAYYADTKTLEIVSGKSGYNETGDYIHDVADGEGWKQYINEIEHLIVGDNIAKISGGAFYDYPNLIDCRLGREMGQLDGSFINCPKFTTIWRDGTERVEGRADLSKIHTTRDCFSGNAIKEIVLNKDIQSYGFTLPMNITTIYNSKITDELKAYCKASYIDLINIKDPTEIYKNWVYIDESLPKCGMKATFAFDEATGTLTISGAGIVDDIVNYYGGGSKTSPWFDIKQQIKHVVIEDGITELGKYTFCQAANLETVEIPDDAAFKILNGAFEKCTALKSIYRRGTDPIEGTLDLRNMEEIPSWTFGEAYLIANVVFGENIKKINKSSFDSNPNLTNIYGVPGSAAEKFATDNGVTFLDISSNTPQPITCTPPVDSESVESTAESMPESETVIDSESIAESESQTESEKLVIDFVDNEEKPSYALYIIIGAVALAAVLAVVIIVIVKKRKK